MSLSETPKTALPYADDEPFSEFVPAIRETLGRGDVLPSHVKGWGTHFWDCVNMRRGRPFFVLQLASDSYVVLPKEFQPIPKT